VLRAHGGRPGLRGATLLGSAVAAPQATFEGEPLIADPVEIAAAYLFYLCRNHPFVDGNERTAPAACLVFLAMLAGEIRRQRANVERMSLKSVRERLIHWLLTEGEGGRFALRTTRKELAAELGVTHEAL
jgi:death-on-curing protein